MKDKDLYNKIMLSDSVKVDNILNEKFGVIEFDNEQFHNKINEIVEVLCHASNKCIIEEISPDILFNKVTINFSDILTWLKDIDFYYSYDYNVVSNLFQGDAIVPDQYNELKGFIEVDNGYIQKASIFLAINLNDINVNKKIKKIILHELGHLYTNKNLKSHHLKNNDLINHYARNVNACVEQIEVSDINNLSEDSIWDIFTYIMYYTNISESHAFMENINFEMLNTLSSPANYKLNLKYKHIERTEYNLFKYSSGTLQIYCWLNELLESCKSISEETKEKFNIKYREEIKNIYRMPISYNKLLKKYQKTIQHILNNCKKLYTEYSNLYDINKQYLMEKYIFSD